jgi:hypothetical protein
MDDSVGADDERPEFAIVPLSKIVILAVLLYASLL